MKIDEAINILKQYIDYNNPDIPDFYTMEEACEVVIKALEQEPCDIQKLKVGDTVLVKCKVEAVFTNSQMVMVTTKDCDKGFDAYIDEIVCVCQDNIKQIKQEPCDDAISRQAAIDVVRKWFNKIQLNGDICLDGIISLPPVTPQPKMGQWSHDGSHWENRWICSECGYKLIDMQTNYCPNCGAKMQEVEE